MLSKHEPHLRTAVFADASNMAQLHAICFKRGWSEDEIEAMLKDQSVISTALFSKNILIGFALSRLAADEAEVLTLAVEPQKRARGYGNLIMHQHLSQIAFTGCLDVFLEVGISNIFARRLYEKNGFLEVGRRKGYYAHRADSEDAIVLKRNLSHL